MENKLLLFTSVIIVFFSCNKISNKQLDSDNSNTKHIVQCDSIIYELPEKATNAFLNLIEGKKVSFCYLGRYADNNKYTFSFSYDDKTRHSKRDSILLQKTNTYLKLRDKFYPVINDFDYIFSNIPISDDGYLNEFKFCFISVNAQGEVLDGFAY